MGIRKLISDIENRYRKALTYAGWSVIAGITLTGSSVLMSPHPENLIPIIEKPARIDGIYFADGVEHVKMPKEVRGFYMTSYTAASYKLRTGLFEYAKRNDLNSVVIDIKDFGGQLAFDTKSPRLERYASEKPTISDLDAVLDEAGKYGLYRIARLFVFQDPLYAREHPNQAVLDSNHGGVWTDYKGISWVDPAAKQAWKYNADVAREVFARGFDEVQLDYIRFPSDGKLSTLQYSVWDKKTPKHEVIRQFYEYMHNELEVKSGIPISLDLFGYVTWYRDFDLGIGQLMTAGLPNSTAISAMVYPSHYTSGALGFSNPAEHPYEIVQASLAKTNTLYADHKKACAGGASEFVVSGTGTGRIAMPCGVPLASQRPWLQAFDIGAEYTRERIMDQVRAARDEGASGWLLWNARNVYRDIK